MVGLEQLTALDLYLWYGQGQAVADTLHLSQSTVSRQARAAMQVFGLHCRPGAFPRELLGDQSLLLAERRVHQMARFRGMAPLRLEATYCTGPWFVGCLPPGWITSRFDLPGITRPLQLLRPTIRWPGSGGSARGICTASPAWPSPMAGFPAPRPCSRPRGSGGIR